MISSRAITFEHQKPRWLWTVRRTLNQDETGDMVVTYSGAEESFDAAVEKAQEAVRATWIKLTTRGMPFGEETR